MDNNIKDRHSIITLADWFRDSHTTEEKADIIEKIDASLNDYHTNGFNILSFNPNDITIDIDDDLRIGFLSYSEDSSDSYVADNIHSAGVLAFSIYMERDLFQHEDFLKLNFDEFAKFLPDGEAPYYRGVIQRNAPVYLNEFLNEKAKRELEKYKDEEIKNSDYNSYNGSNAAYMRSIVQPMIITVLGLVIILIALILRFV